MSQSNGTIIFGNPNDCAFEVGVAPYYGSYIRLQIWCGGIPLGDVEKDFCEITRLIEGRAWLSQHLDELWDESLTGLDDEATWTLLDQIVFNYDGVAPPEDDRTLEDFICDFARFDRFSFLDNWGQRAEPIKAFLVNHPSKSLRVLSRQFPPNVGLAVTISGTGLMTAWESLLAWLYKQPAVLESGN